ncbi:uncharacterized protein G2W53_029230 [Senna tora]|uniref:Uncharacterized protein n=1 Tax=Senna tora TaxID=362788 RepID=A0A834T532_9FABA|nr:uncharacterized protein G2W53_029230 [Senna tora]
MGVTLRSGKEIPGPETLEKSHKEDKAEFTPEPEELPK